MRFASPSLSKAFLKRPLFFSADRSIRRKITEEYHDLVKKLIANRAWPESPPPEDQPLNSSAFFSAFLRPERRARDLPE